MNELLEDMDMAVGPDKYKVGRELAVLGDLRRDAINRIGADTLHLAEMALTCRMEKKCSN